MDRAEHKAARGFRIGELADRLGLNPKTIRYYEECGLLPAASRTASGYRRYDNADYERLRFILKAKAIDLTLAQIRDILILRDAGQTPCGHVVQLLDDKLALVDTQLQALQELRGALVGLREEATARPPAAACVCGIIEFHEPPQRARARPRMSELAAAAWPGVRRPDRRAAIS